jgi:hypothetical protein
MHRYRKSLVNNCQTLKDLNYNLAMALIQSSLDPYFQNVLVKDHNRHRGEMVLNERSEIGAVGGVTINWNLNTLHECITTEKFPKKNRYQGFKNRRNVVELSLMENDEFEHFFSKTNTQKFIARGERRYFDVMCARHHCAKQ